MPRLFATALAVALLLPIASGAQDRVDLTDRTDAEKLSYAFGFDSAQSIQADSASFAYFDLDTFERGFQLGASGDSTQIAFMFGYQFGNRVATDPNDILDADRFLDGFREALVFDASQFSEDELNRISTAIQTEIQMRRLREEAETDSLARQKLETIETNAAAAAAFLAEVAMRDSVVALPSGVLYSESAVGTGEAASGDGTVRVIYTGRLADGTEFDSSDGEAVPFDLGRVVPGFRDGLTGTMAGTKRTLYIPPTLGYGLSGAAGGAIPPNAALVFEVEIVEVMTMAPPPPPPPMPQRRN
ncbi:MAG: FKBP-type peptidyl-prolyl cis-trans isomerase [Bacteroidota bacterium]